MTQSQLWGQTCSQFASSGLSAKHAHPNRESYPCCHERRLEGLPSATTEAMAYESLSQVATGHQRTQQLETGRGPCATSCRHDGGEGSLCCQHRHRCRERSTAQDRVSRHPLGRAPHEADVICVTASDRHRRASQPASELGERYPDERPFRSAPSFERTHRPTFPRSSKASGGCQATMRAQRDPRKRSGTTAADRPTTDRTCGAGPEVAALTRRPVSRLELQGSACYGPPCRGPQWGTARPSDKLRPS
jgi:hypothetical protein